MGQIIFNMRVHNHKLGLEVRMNEGLEDIKPEIRNGKEFYHFCNMKWKECPDVEYRARCPNYTLYERLKEKR